MFRGSEPDWRLPDPTRGDATTEEWDGYSLSVESELVYVRHRGTLSTRVIESSRRAVAQVTAETGLAHVLLDLSRAASGLAALEIFELCASQPSALPAGMAVAVVHRPGQFVAEDAHFAEMVSLNRGVSLRTFTDLEAAQRWLSEG